MKGANTRRKPVERMAGLAGGKGSAPRPLAVDNETFSGNWDRIFRKDEQAKPEGSLETTDGQAPNHSDPRGIHPEG